MPRKHLFPLVVLLAAAVLAGVFALARTVDLARPANASTRSDAAIAFRLKELDRFEGTLRKQLAVAKKAAPSSPRTVYRRAEASVSAPAVSHREEHETDHAEQRPEREGRDD
jgi:hypothetical protein